MPIPGLTDAYQFVDWLKARKYHVNKGEQITITGETGGLITVDLCAETSWAKVCRWADEQAARGETMDSCPNSPQVIAEGK